MHIDAAVEKAFGEMISGMAAIVAAHRNFVITPEIKGLPVHGDDGRSIDLPGFDLTRAVVCSETPIISHSYVITDGSLKVEPKSSITILQTLEMFPQESYLNAIEAGKMVIHLPARQLSPLTAIRENYTIIPAVQLQFDHRRAEPSGDKVEWFVTAKFWGNNKNFGPVFGMREDTNSRYIQEPLDFLGRMRMLPVAADPIKTFKLLADALASGPKYDYLPAAVSI